jgi:hypothetical protein
MERKHPPHRGKIILKQTLNETILAFPYGIPE